VSKKNHHSHTNILVELSDANIHKITGMSPAKCKLYTGNTV